MPIELDLDGLLAPLAPDAPCGKDLRYDPRFTALQAAAEPGLDYVVGPDGREQEVPKRRDWPRITKDVLALLGQSRDLRLLVILAEALTAGEGAAGFAAGLTLLRRSLEAWWDGIHPALDREEATPAEQAAQRLNALRRLSATDGMLSELRRMRLAQAPGMGAVSLRALELARGEVPPQPEEAKPELTQLEAVFRAAPATALAESLAALDAAADELQAIERLFADKLGDPAATPDSRPLTALLGRLRATLAEHGGRTAAAEPVAAAPPGPANPAAGAAEMPPPLGADGAAGGLVARLESREEVVQALELVLDYYRRREPASPIPLLVQRAQRLVPLSFFEVMEDLAPDAMPQLRALAGRAG